MNQTQKQRSFHVRFTVPHVGAAIEATHDEGQGGIVLLGERHGGAGAAAALALLVDLEGLGLANDGASATNAATDIVRAYRATLAHVLGVPECVIAWAQLDSMGNFDVFHPNGKESTCTHVSWEPVTSRSRPPRSLTAFLERFPVVGGRALARLESIAHKDLATALYAVDH